MAPQTDSGFFHLLQLVMLHSAWSRTSLFQRRGLAGYLITDSITVFTSPAWHSLDRQSTASKVLVWGADQFGHREIWRSAAISDTPAHDTHFFFDVFLAFVGFLSFTFVAFLSVDFDGFTAFFSEAFLALAFFFDADLAEPFFAVFSASALSAFFAFLIAAFSGVAAFLEDLVESALVRPYLPVFICVAGASSGTAFVPSAVSTGVDSAVTVTSSLRPATTLCAAARSTEARWAPRRGMLSKISGEIFANCSAVVTPIVARCVASA
jgi:hypothetical protein